MSFSKRKLDAILHQQIFNSVDPDTYLRSLGPAAWFRAGWGQTVTGSGVSQWDDISGNARHLKQGTDANRPVSLLHSGTNYLYCPGVAGNYASTPDSVAASINGPMTIVMRLSAVDWTPSSALSPIGKAQTNTTRSWYFQFNATTFTFFSSPDGTAPSQVSGAISMGSSPFTDGDIGWIRVDFTPDDGAGNRVYSLYKASDQEIEPSSWTQVGSTTTIAGATSIHDNNSEIGIGGLIAATANIWNGKIYRAIVKNGIDGTTVVDFDPSLATDQASSFVASTGETWTINSTGSKPAQIVGRSSLLFNGAAHFLKCDAFTLNQPTTVLMVVKQVSWANVDALCDGDAIATGQILQFSSSARLAINAGAGGTALNATPTLGDYLAVCAILDAASSSLTVGTSTTTGNPGTANMGGFTLGSRGGGGSQYSNIQVAEVILLPIALDALTRYKVVRALMQKYAVS